MPLCYIYVINLREKRLYLKLIKKLRQKCKENSSQNMVQKVRQIEDCYILPVQ